MKKNILKLMMIVLSIGLTAFLSCDDDSDTESAGGREYLLTGSWWVSGSGTGEGYYFDGAGGGYDLSLVDSTVTIMCDNEITYTYNGHDLHVVEPGSTSGYDSRAFTFVFIDGTTAAITILGFGFTANRLDLIAGCIE